MKVLVVGATGTIGRNVAGLLAEEGHQVVSVGHRDGDHQIDIESKESIGSLFAEVGPVDVIVSTAGAANFAPFEALRDEDYQLALNNKLMGQVNLVRVGAAHVNDSGSIILTSGVLSREPIPGSVAVSMVNGAIESFVRAAAVELGSRIRINAVSPVFVKETMEMMGMDSTHGVSAANTAKAYLAAIRGAMNGQTLDVPDFI